jgi:hypothetical protein
MVHHHVMCCDTGQPQCNFYLFFVHGAYINLAGAIDYFYTADEHCVPNGPHFTYTYYSTWSSVVQSIMGAVGVMLFQVSHKRLFFVARP